MTECHSELPYDFPTQRPLVVRFSDLELSSDAGILLARQAEEQVQVCRGLAECIQDWRDPNKITHSLHQLVSQRVYQLVGGYEDANDSNVLRHDPIFKIACERLPKAGTDLLASQPTITRLENHVGKVEVAAMRSRMVDGFIKGYKSTPEELVLDIDGWDDPTHGNQQLSCFHGYYGQHMYFPVLINEAKTGYPLVLQLRAGNSHSGKGVAGILRWLFWRLKRAWPTVRLILRADAGFSLPEIIQVCERSNIGYALGFSRHAVLDRKIADLLERARLQHIKTQQKARLFDDVYYAARTWDAPRRLVMKAEWLDKGPNPRFVVTNLEQPSQRLYDHFYVHRGSDSEHRIKELKLGIKADRLSCSSFIANQFRLLLAQAAYILTITIRQAAAGTQLAKTQVERLRLLLIKGAAKVTVSARRILVELAAFSPFAKELRQITQNLSKSLSLKFE
jgi:Transposase DDE domain group 1